MAEDENAFEDLTELGSELEEAELTAQARERYKSTESYQAVLRSDYRRFHFYYHPPGGDQWPEDQAARPGMIHITQNIIQPAVDTESRIESELPVINLNPGTVDPETRARAELAEKVYLAFLEQSDWDIWFNEAAKAKAIYGKTVLHPYWNEEEERPDVSVVELPDNLRIGWGSSDFRDIDWAIYEYTLSPREVLLRWPEVTIEGAPSGYRILRKAAGDHADPVDTLEPFAPTTFGNGNRVINRYTAYGPSDYEGEALRIWDYWFEDGNDDVYNAVFVEGILVEGPTKHPEMPDIPYIVIEHDHEPGSPEGIGMVESLIDVQLEINRALSHFAQLVADEIDPAWQVDADYVAPGTVPKAGEVTAAGEGRTIKAIEKPVNQFPIQQLVAELYKSFHFNTGMPEILFSLPPGAQTAGRALAIQVESAANRIGPRRARLYKGLKYLLNFWGYMLQEKDPQVDSPDGKVSLGELVSGLKRWEIIAPEITPRDNVEHTTNTINKIQAKTISLEDGMKELGVESPLEMLQRIENERTNPKLFPGETQAYLAVSQLMLQLQQQMQQMQQQQQAQQQAEQQAAAAAPNPLQAGLNAEGQQMADMQNSQPTLTPEMNQSGPTQPMGQQGAPAAAGAGLPFGNQTLIRSTPTGGAQALQQIKIAPPAPGGM